MKRNNENSIASEMDSIMKSSDFEKLFSREGLVKAAQANTAQDMNCAHVCEKDHDHSHKCTADCSPADDMDPVSAAVQEALTSLAKLSEVLDEAGLEKTAALSLNLAQHIVVEAKKKKEEEKNPKDKKDKKDEKKNPKDVKDPKKDDKKSDKKDVKKK